jgi:branched-chain amino acid transport system permease protein
MTLGLSLLWGYCGTLSFGQVAFFGISGYIYAIFTINFGDSTIITILGVIAGLTATAIIAAFFGYFVFYGQVSGWIIPVLTLALTLILELFLGQTAGYEWRVGRAFLGGFNGINNIVPLKIGSLKLASGTLSLYYFALLTTIFLFLLIRMFVNSKWGAVIVSIREDSERTRMLGHNVNFIQVVVFVISALLAGLSGLIYVWWGNFIDPSSVGMISATLPVVYTVVGGKESLLATILSTASLAFVGDYLAVRGGQYAVLVNGILLLGVMMFCPRGVFLTIGEWFKKALSKKFPPKDLRLVKISDTDRNQVLQKFTSDSKEVKDAVSESDNGSFLLELKNTSKFFGGIKALTDVSLSIREGELRCLIGPNGAGKSTLFNLISGLYLPDSGSIFFCGQEITRIPPYKRVRNGVIMKFQTTRIYNTLTLSENLDIAYRSDGHLNKDRNDHYSLLSIFGLQNYIEQTAGVLTHVQKQWLEICLALAARPRLLLLDEPTAGMTPEETKQTAELIKMFRKSGLTIIVVEHDMEFIKQIAEQITVLHQGRIFAEGELASIEKNKEVRRIYLGEQ